MHTSVLLALQLIFHLKIRCDKSHKFSNAEYTYKFGQWKLHFSGSELAAATAEKCETVSPLQQMAAFICEHFETNVLKRRR